MSASAAFDFDSFISEVDAIVGDSTVGGVPTTTATTSEPPATFLEEEDTFEDFSLPPTPAAPQPTAEAPPPHSVKRVDMVDAAGTDDDDDFSFSESPVPPPTQHSASVAGGVPAPEDDDLDFSEFTDGLDLAPIPHHHGPVQPSSSSSSTVPVEQEEDDGALNTPEVSSSPVAPTAPVAAPTPAEAGVEEGVLEDAFAHTLDTPIVAAASPTFSFESTPLPAATLPPQPFPEQQQEEVDVGGEEDEFGEFDTLEGVVVSSTSTFSPLPLPGTEKVGGKEEEEEDDGFGDFDEATKEVSGAAAVPIMQGTSEVTVEAAGDDEFGEFDDSSSSPAVATVAAAADAADTAPATPPSPLPPQFEEAFIMGGKEKVAEEEVVVVEDGFGDFGPSPTLTDSAATAQPASAPATTAAAPAVPAAASPIGVDKVAEEEGFEFGDLNGSTSPREAAAILSSSSAPDAPLSSFPPQLDAVAPLSPLPPQLEEALQMGGEEKEGGAGGGVVVTVVGAEEGKAEDEFGAFDEPSFSPTSVTSLPLPTPTPVSIDSPPSPPEVAVVAAAGVVEVEGGDDEFGGFDSISPSDLPTASAASTAPITSPLSEEREVVVVAKEEVEEDGFGDFDVSLPTTSVVSPPSPSPPISVDTLIPEETPAPAPAPAPAADLTAPDDVPSEPPANEAVGGEVEAPSVPPASEGVGGEVEGEDDDGFGDFDGAEEPPTTSVAAPVAAAAAAAAPPSPLPSQMEAEPVETGGGESVAQVEKVEEKEQVVEEELGSFYDDVVPAVPTETPAQAVVMAGEEEEEEEEEKAEEGDDFDDFDAFQDASHVELEGEEVETTAATVVVGADEELEEEEEDDFGEMAPPAAPVPTTTTTSSFFSKPPPGAALDSLPPPPPPPPSLPPSASFLSAYQDLCRSMATPGFTSACAASWNAHPGACSTTSSTQASSSTTSAVAAVTPEATAQYMVGALSAIEAWRASGGPQGFVIGGGEGGGGGGGAPTTTTLPGHSAAAADVVALIISATFEGRRRWREEGGDGGGKGREEEEEEEEAATIHPPISTTKGGLPGGLWEKLQERAKKAPSSSSSSTSPPPGFSDLPGQVNPWKKGWGVEGVGHFLMPRPGAGERRRGNGGGGSSSHHHLANSSSGASAPPSTTTTATTTSSKSKPLPPSTTTPHPTTTAGGGAAGGANANPLDAIIAALPVLPWR